MASAHSGAPECRSRSRSCRGWTVAAVRQPEVIPILGIMAYFLGLSTPIAGPPRLVVAAGGPRLLSVSPMTELVYKICPAAALQQARKRGRYDGSADDRRDGFI